MAASYALTPVFTANERQWTQESALGTQRNAHPARFYLERIMRIPIKAQISLFTTLVGKPSKSAEAGIHVLPRVLPSEQKKLLRIMSSSARLCSASDSVHSMEPLEQSIQFKSGAVYTGSVKKGSKTRCGQGTFTWPSGLQYAGEFLNNKRHGTGVQVWPDGSRYEGGFREDMRHGHGRHCWENGEVGLLKSSYL